MPKCNMIQIHAQDVVFGEWRCREMLVYIDPSQIVSMKHGEEGSAIGDDWELTMSSGEKFKVTAEEVCRLELL